jgi:Holliday junction resolvase RusA-like endonuclease
MRHIYKRIKGIPYCRSKHRGNVGGLRIWTASIIRQTRTLPRVEEACVVQVTFLLPENKYPTNYPYGPDIDNLLKRFFDGLNKTIFSKAKGRDSCVAAIFAVKSKVKTEKQAGVLLEIFPISTFH